MATKKAGGKKKITELTPQHHTAIESLLKTGLVKDAARAARVSKNTVYTWLKREDFAAELRQLTVVSHLEVSARVNEAVIAAITQAQELIKLSNRDDGPRALIIKSLLEHHRWQVERVAGIAKGGVDPKAGPAGSSVVVKVQPMTADEVAAARETARALHERGGPGE